MRSVRAVWWCLLAPGLLAGGEHVVTDFVDGVVQMLEGFGDLLPGSVMRQGGAGSGYLGTGQVWTGSPVCAHWR